MLDQSREKIASFKANPEKTALSSSETIMVQAATASKEDPIGQLLKLDADQLRAAYEERGKDLGLSADAIGALLSLR